MVSKALNDPEKVEVRFFDNRIEITVSKKESERKTRSSKTGRKMFELFCGGGTMHHFFKKTGFESVGGLEMQDNYLAVFEQNNPHDDKITICASIEDVSPTDYPDNIDLLVCGIPCTTFSQGNLIMTKELRKLRSGESVDPNVVAKRFEAEALVYHVLRAIEQMNPKQCVIEEVPSFAQSNASMLLRTVLTQMGYHLSEVVAEALHTKRKRWCLVADMNREVDLTNLPNHDGKVIADFLEGDLDSRDWKEVQHHKRFKKASETIGLRYHKPCEARVNTITTHHTRSTEPCLKHPFLDVYDEFSNQEIANLHGLKGFILPEGKTLARQVLGQGVTDLFDEISRRVFASSLTSDFGVKTGSRNQLSLKFA